MHKNCPFWYRRSIFAVLCLLLTFSFVGCSSSKGSTSVIPTPSPTLQDASTRLNKLFLSESHQDNFSGVLLIKRNGKLLFEQAYGMADSQHSIANLPTTKFRIASLAEQFNALAILLLQDQGKLKVQNSVCNYISGCPAAWQSVTISQLLTHTSGLTDYTTLGDYNETKALPTTPGQLIDRFKDKPLAFKPGVIPAWSTSDEVLLGSIIEKVSGQSYANYLQHAIFNPLHLYNTGYDQNPATLADHAIGYKQPHIPSDIVDISVLYAAGGLYSTVDDLYTFDQALINHKIGSRAALSAMFALQWSWCSTGGPCGSASTQIGLGYGWIIGKQKINNSETFLPIYFNNGSFEGFSASNRYYPDQKLTVIWLSNIQNLSLDVDNLVQNILFPSPQS